MLLSMPIKKNAKLASILCFPVWKNCDFKSKLWVIKNYWFWYQTWTNLVVISNSVINRLEVVSSLSFHKGCECTLYVFVVLKHVYHIRIQVESVISAIYTIHTIIYSNLSNHWFTLLILVSNHWSVSLILKLQKEA